MVSPVCGPHKGGGGWVSPQSVSEAYHKALNYEDVAIDEILAEVDDFVRALRNVPAHIKQIFVPAWAPIHPFETRRGLLDLDPKLGISSALMRMNIRLAD